MLRTCFIFLLLAVSIGSESRRIRCDYGLRILSIKFSTGNQKGEGMQSCVLKTLKRTGEIQKRH